MPRCYGVAFGITLLINLDLLWRLAKSRDFSIDFVNYLVTLLWVLANGLWAFGEMVANVDATEDEFRRYSWPNWQDIHGTYFQFRFAAGWVFLLAVVVLFGFYLHWIVVSMRRKLPSYEDYAQARAQAV